MNDSYFANRMTICFALLLALCVIASVSGNAQTASESAAGRTLINPAHPELGTIDQNIANLKKLEHIPGKPWALVGWSQATRLTGNKAQWIVFDYYHSRRECLAGRQSNMDYDRGTELAANDASSKCVQVGKEEPLEWEMIGWHVTEHRWVKLDRYPAKSDCETALRVLLNASADSKAECLPSHQ